MPGKQELTRIVADKSGHMNHHRGRVLEEVAFHLRIEKWLGAGQIKIG